MEMYIKLWHNSEIKYTINNLGQNYLRLVQLNAISCLSKKEICTFQIMVKNLEKELSLLKKELAMHDTLANRSQVTYDPLSEQQRYEIRQQVRAYLDGRAEEIDVS